MDFIYERAFRTTNITQLKESSMFFENANFIWIFELLHFLYKNKFQLIINGFLINLMYIRLLTNMFTYCKDVPRLFIAFSFSYNRFMLFSDNYPDGRITRASLDGRNATVIVYQGLVRVASLTVDPDNNLLL